MTICIALACESFKRGTSAAMVLVLDRAVSLGGMTSLETAVKGRRIGNLWHAMVAGNDASHAISVIKKVVRRVSELGDNISSAVLEEHFSNAYKEVRQKQVEDLFLSSFGWSLNKFTEDGMRLLPVSEFSQLLSEIQRFDLGCEFLVAGFPFANARDGDIFRVTNPGVATPEEVCSFAAIGSGAVNAYSYLARREQAAHLSLPETIYNGVAAKILAEKALGIGRETHVVVFKSNGYHAMLENVEDIRELWKREEENARPADLAKRVNDLMKLNRKRNPRKKQKGKNREDR